MKNENLQVLVKAESVINQSKIRRVNQIEQIEQIDQIDQIDQIEWEYTC